MPRLIRLTLLVAALLVPASLLTTAAQAADAPRRKVIIDQDAFGPAGSNMQAILMLLQAREAEVLGIVCTSGDGWRDEEVANTLRLLEIAGRTEIPVYGGAVYPLVNSQARTQVWERLHGALYYKGAWTETWPDQGAVRRTPYHADPFLVPPSPIGVPRIKPQAEHGAAFMVRKVHEFPGQVTILTAGPMTTVALAARLDPSFAATAEQLVFMGASFNPQPADNDFAKEFVHSPRREFNMRWDAEAASLVLREPWKQITAVPVDPTTRTFFKREFIDHIAATGKAPFTRYLADYGQSFPMWDELAVAVWLRPSLVTRSQRMLVDIDTSFTAGYGGTLSWPVGGGPGLGERDAIVVQDVDVPAFEQLTLDLLTRARP